MENVAVLENISLIYSPDFDMQVISFLPDVTLEGAWALAEAMDANGVFKEMGVEHDDVMHFTSTPALNEWLMEQLKESRRTRNIILE